MQVTHLKTWHNHFLWGSLVQAQACKDICKIDAHLERVNLTLLALMYMVTLVVHFQLTALTATVTSPGFGSDATVF